jgi:hypothetical protein
VCSINSTLVAVTFPYGREVCFISVGGQMSTANKIHTGFQCYGLAYTNENLYVSDYNTEVHIYTLSGLKLNKLRITLRIKKTIFSHIMNQLTDQDQLQKIYSLAVSKDATRIYVIDNDHGLIVLDKNCQVITKFNCEKLQMANCCYVTEAGSVLVSGRSSNNVLQFTSDGELIGEVIKADSGKGYIISVCCNEQMSKMYVCKSGNNNIEVYDI